MKLPSGSLPAFMGRYQPDRLSKLAAAVVDLRQSDRLCWREHRLANDGMDSTGTAFNYDNRHLRRSGNLFGYWTDQYISEDGLFACANQDQVARFGGIQNGLHKIRAFNDAFGDMRIIDPLSGIIQHLLRRTNSLLLAPGGTTCIKSTRAGPSSAAAAMTVAIFTALRLFGPPATGTSTFRIGFFFL